MRARKCQYRTTSDGQVIANPRILATSAEVIADILAGKAESAGRRVLLVDPAGTSSTCCQCGQHCTRPRQDTVVCPVHGAMDADVNAARNIFTRAGLGSSQAAPAA